MSSVLFDVYVVMYHEASKVIAHNVVVYTYEYKDMFDALGPKSIIKNFCSS